MAAALQLLDLLADRAGLFLAVPASGDGDLLARHVLGVQGLAEPAFVVGDQIACGGEDVPGAAVVPLQPDHLGARESRARSAGCCRPPRRASRRSTGRRRRRSRCFWAARARSLAPSPGVARRRRASKPGAEERVGVRGVSGVRCLAASPHPASFARRPLPASGRGQAVRGGRPLRQQPQPQILRHVGVLILVHQDVAEPALILPQHLRVLAEQPDHLQQQVAEVRGVQNLQPLLERGIELLAAAVGESRRLAGRHLVGRQPAVLPVVDQPGQHPRRPALLVDALDLEQLLEQPDLVVGVENGEVALQPDQLGVPAQHLHADRVERAEPRHALDRLADHGADPLLHLAGGLVGERHREDLARPRAAGGENVRDPRGQHAGLAGSGAGQHQQRPVQRLDRLPLLRVHGVEIAGRPRTRRERTRRDAAGHGGGRFDGHKSRVVLPDQPRPSLRTRIMGRKWHSQAGFARGGADSAGIWG